MTDFTDTEEILEGPPPLEPGEIIAPGYEAITHLHRSNNFDVYDTWSEERACRCIAKTPIPDLIEDRKVARGLFREGRLLRKLTHPHIVRAYETITGPPPALILETLTGATLTYLIDTSPRRLPLADITHLGLHLCSAVHYLHRNWCPAADSQETQDCFGEMAAGKPTDPLGSNSPEVCSPLSLSFRESIHPGVSLGHPLLVHSCHRNPWDRWNEFWGRVSTT